MPVKFIYNQKERRPMPVKFIYNQKEYESNWTEGYAFIEESGFYLHADFSNGKPENIRRIALFVMPQNFSVAYLTSNKK
jgi:hypothetical protein